MNKVFNASANGFNYRLQRFSFRDVDGRDGYAETHQIIKGLVLDSEKAQMLKNIRSILIEAHGRRESSRQDAENLADDHTKEKWAPLCTLIAAIPHLKSFTWQGLVYHGADQLPACLINAIQLYHPRAHLHIQNWTRVRDDEDHNNEDELTLANSRNLRSIQAKLFTPPIGFDLKRAALKRIIALAPNLETVDISEGSSGCVVRQVTIEQIIDEEQRSKMFEVEERPKNALKSVKSRGSNFFETSQDVVDLSKLERLDIDYVPDGDFFGDEGVVGKFSKLKDLSIILNKYSTAGTDERFDNLRTFLTCCKPLESLSLTNRGTHLQLAVILANNGPALRSLALHEIETSSPGEPRATLSISDIEEIRRLCPLLENLTVDLDRASSADSKKAVLSELAKFPRLSIIGIYFDLGVAEEAARTPWVFLDDDEVKAEAASHQANPFHPFKDSGWLENMWSVLRRDKREYGAIPLRELHVKVGEWERERGGGYPAGWVIWEASHRRYYIAKASERDDRPDEISVQVMGSTIQHNKGHEIRPLPSDFGLWKTYSMNEQ